MNLNQIIVSGYLVRNPELKQVADKDMTTFVLANNTGFGEHSNANFFNCICWGNQAKYIGNYKKKGDYLAISGEINIKSYKAKDGTNKQTIQITVKDVDAPKAEKVNTNDVDRTYDQEVNTDFSNLVDKTIHEAGLDGSANPQQVATSQKKPYKPFETKVDVPFTDINSDISADDLPF